MYDIRKRFVFIFMIMLIAAATIPGRAQSYKKTGQAGMTFLKIDGNARAAALGGSYVAQNSDVISIFYNPAGLGSMEGAAVSVSQTNWIADIKHNSIAAAYSFGKWGVVGLSLVDMDYGTLHGTTVSFSSSQSFGFEYEETGTFEVDDYAIGMAYATSVTDRFNVGIHVRYVKEDMGENFIQIGDVQKVSQNEVDNIAVDVGTIYNTGFKDLTLGMSVRNFSSETTYPNLNEGFYMPLVYSVGVAVDLFKFFIPESESQKLMLCIEGQHPNDNLERLNLGAEYQYTDWFFLRGGYKINYDIEDFSGGLGVNLEVAGMNLQFDYAVSRIKYFDNVNRLSLTIHL